MTDMGITGYGAYMPRQRLNRRAIAEAHRWMAPALKAQAKGARAFASWDEDPVTMAVEAGRDALGGVTDAAPATLSFASTRAPYTDLQHSAIIAGALGLPPSMASMDLGASQRAGTSGLLQSLRGGQSSLFIASDAPLGKPASVQEMAFGAGAAAFLTGTENVAAKFLGGATVTANFVGHFRGASQRFDYYWEDRWIRDEGYGKLAPAAIKAALADAEVTMGDIDHFAMPSLLRGGAKATIRAMGYDGAVADDLAAECGYAGAAHAPLMLAAVLEQAKPGERILVVGFGQGADAIVLEATDAIQDARPARGVSGALARSVPSDSYLRMLSFAELIDLEWGMRSEKDAKTALTEQYRSAPQVASFNAGRCAACGTIQFPQLEVCVNPACRAPAAQFTPVSLVDEAAAIMTYTADWLTYHPAPPLYVGFVQFANGARVLMEIVDVGPDGVEVADPVSMVFRVKEKDRKRGYNRYFWKATPA